MLSDFEIRIHHKYLHSLYFKICIVGLTADARILINRARIECQSHKLTVEDPVTLEYITRYIAQLKQVKRQEVNKLTYMQYAILLK